MRCPPAGLPGASTSANDWTLLISSFTVQDASQEIRLMLQQVIKALISTAIYWNNVRMQVS